MFSYIFYEWKIKVSSLIHSTFSTLICDDYSIPIVTGITKNGVLTPDIFWNLIHVLYLFIRVLRID